MTVEKIDDGRICILLTEAERNIISNCMNYMCRGRPPKDFHALVGARIEEADKLLELLVSV